MDSTRISGRSRHPWRAGAPLVTLAAVLSLAGCSEGEKREYAVPSDLCGVEVGGDLLDPFLPLGKKIAVTPAEPVDGITRCRVEVDGDVALQVAVEEWKNKPSLREIAAGQAYAKPEEMSSDKTYLYSDRGAVSKAECPQPTEPGAEVFTVVQVPESGTGDKDAMQRLIKAYTAAVSTSEVCTGQ